MTESPETAAPTASRRWSDVCPACKGYPGYTTCTCAPQGPETLFDPKTLERPRCPHCQAAARNACAHNANIAAGTAEPLSRRPRGCIASPQLQPHEPLPF